MKNILILSMLSLSTFAQVNKSDSSIVRFKGDDYLKVTEVVFSRIDVDSLRNKFKELKQQKEFARIDLQNYIELRRADIDRISTEMENLKKLYSEKMTLDKVESKGVDGDIEEQEKIEELKSVKYPQLIRNPRRP